MSILKLSPSPQSSFPVASTPIILPHPIPLISLPDRSLRGDFITSEMQG